MNAPSTPRSQRLAVLLLGALAAAACTAAPGATSTASPSSIASPAVSPAASEASTSEASTSTPGASAPVGHVASAEDAFRAVQARSPWFDGIAPRDATMIGQAAWWEAAAAANGAWGVTVTVGWGDCPAGCIDHHSWEWTVAADGTVVFLSESGAAMPPEERTSLAANATGPGIGGQVTAGPVCPVVQPGQSGCDDRPVAGAVLVVQGPDGMEIARFKTDASGLFRIPLTAGGYTLAPQPVEGLMGTPAAQPVQVAADRLEVVAVTYDTGIR